MIIKPSLSESKAAKKIVSVEVLHLDKVGYGPKGKHTRKEWREECLRYLQKGATAFLGWQQSWNAELPQNKKVASFEVLVTCEDGGVYKTGTDISGSIDPSAYVLDFSGQLFNDNFSVENFHFLENTIFNAARFPWYSNFDSAIFDKSVWFDGANFDVLSATFNNAQFNKYVSFNHSLFNTTAMFRNAKFAGHALFNYVSFNYSAHLEGAIFDAEASFNNVTFNQFALFSNVTFAKTIDFKKTNFLQKAYFENVKFMGEAKYEEVIFKDLVTFKTAAFADMADFSYSNFIKHAIFENASFSKEVYFYQSEFNDYASFQNVSFLGHSSFKSAKFSSVGHFEEAKFSEIPFFIGTKIDGTQLEFSDDTLFTQDDFLEEAIKNISYLKRLADEHGQLDQALNFNAMELHAKRKLALEPLTYISPDRLIFDGVLWETLPTGLYGYLSNYGRSFTRPLVALIILAIMTWIIVIAHAIYNSPPPCKNKQQSWLEDLVRDGAPCFINSNDSIKPQLHLSGYRAAFEYSVYRTSNLVDFTDADKQTQAVTQRLFGSQIEPMWMRVYGIFKAILSAILLFLTALGLRNKYRIS